MDNKKRLDNEQRVIGILLRNPELLAEAALEATHFRDGIYRKMFVEIKRQAMESGQVDLFLVAENCKTISMADVALLHRETVGASNFEHYADLLINAEKLERFRECIANAHGYLQNHPQHDCDKVANRLISRVVEISGDGKKKRSYNMEEMCSLYVENSQIAQERVGEGQKIYGITTGIDDLDFKLSGLQKSKYIVIGARPSMGKSSFGEGLAISGANAGYHCGYFGIEPSENEMSFRIISKYSRVSSNKIKRELLEDHELNNITGGIVQCRKKSIRFHIDDNCTIGDIIARSMQWKMEGQLDYIIIDYLQYIKPDKRGRNRLEELSGISRQLKYLAKRLDIAVVALAQLNRNVESRGNKKPVLSDIRECGDIEQDADVIGFLFREYVYNEEADASNGEIIIAKNRDGEIGSVNAHWNPELTEWSNQRVDAYDDFDSPNGKGSSIIRAIK